MQNWSKFLAKLASTIFQKDTLVSKIRPAKFLQRELGDQGRYSQTIKCHGGGEPTTIRRGKPNPNSLKLPPTDFTSDFFILERLSVIWCCLGLFDFYQPFLASFRCDSET